MNESGARIAVVIPAFRRADLLTAVLEALPLDRISEILVSIDGARSRSEEGDVVAVESAAREFAARTSSRLHVRRAMRNLGSAVNVISSVDWLLQRNDAGVILEDDCLATPEFFEFVIEMLESIRNDPSTWLVCGTQLAPSALVDGSHVRSMYPLSWGWAVSRDRWNEMRSILIASLETPGRVIRALGNAEARFWNAGHRRAALGYVDAWDMPLVACMRAERASCILPAVNLVTNVGDDARATHTVGAGNATRRATGHLPRPLRDGGSTASHAIDTWIRHNVFHISARHVVSTRITECRDRFRQPQRDPLLERLDDLGDAYREVVL